MKTIEILKSALKDYQLMGELDQEEHIIHIKQLIHHLNTHVAIHPNRNFYHCSNCICEIPSSVKESVIHVMRVTYYSECEIYHVLQDCILDKTKEHVFQVIP